MLPWLLILSTVTASAGSSAREAHRLVRAGARAYTEGHYAVAVRDWTAADRLQRSAALLLRIGKSCEQLRQPERAAEAYRAYLRRAPMAKDRARVKQLLARLEASVRRQGSALAIVPLAPAVPAPAPPELALAPLVLAPAAPPPHEGEAAGDTPAIAAPAALATEAAPPSRAPWLAASYSALGLSAFSAWYGGYALDALSISSRNQRLAPVGERGVYDAEIRRYTLQGVVGLSGTALLAAGGIYLWLAGPGAAVAAEAVPGGAVASWSGRWP